MGKSNKNEVCFNCQKKGHYASECWASSKKKDGQETPSTKGAGKSTAKAKAKSKGGAKGKGKGRQLLKCLLVRVTVLTSLEIKNGQSPRLSLM